MWDIVGDARSELVGGGGPSGRFWVFVVFEWLVDRLVLHSVRTRRASAPVVVVVVEVVVVVVVVVEEAAEVESGVVMAYAVFYVKKKMEEQVEEMASTDLTAVNLDDQVQKEGDDVMTRSRESVMWRNHMA